MHGDVETSLKFVAQNEVVYRYLDDSVEVTNLDSVGVGGSMILRLSLENRM